MKPQYWHLGLFTYIFPDKIASFVNNRFILYRQSGAKCSEWIYSKIFSKRLNGSTPNFSILFSDKCRMRVRRTCSKRNIHRRHPSEQHK